MYFKIQVLLFYLKMRLRRWWYKHRLEALREKRWNALQRSLVDSPFYKELALERKPLSDYPLMNKERFMANFDTINTVNISREEAFSIAEKAEESRDFSPTIHDITIGLSSGTSGNRGIFLASQTERAMWVACILDRVIGFSLTRRSVAFFLRANSNLYSSVSSRLLNFKFFDILLPLPQHLEQLNKLQPDILVGQPSVLLGLATEKQQGRLSITPSKIISVAEVLTPEDSNFLESVFGQKIHQVYQCTEGLLASTCSHGTLHFNDDFLLIEKKYLDDDKTRFHPVITDLLRVTQPVIRYELNDIIHEQKECPCGSDCTAIEKIEGRSDDVFEFTSDQQQPVRIYPDFIRREIILSHPEIHDYTVVQKSSTLIELYIGNHELYPLAEERLQLFLRSKDIRNVNIQQVLKRNHIPGTKLRRVRNDS